MRLTNCRCVCLSNLQRFLTIFRDFSQKHAFWSLFCSKSVSNSTTLRTISFYFPSKLQFARNITLIYLQKYFNSHFGAKMQTILISFLRKQKKNCTPRKFIIKLNEELTFKQINLIFLSLISFLFKVCVVVLYVPTRRFHLKDINNKSS